MPKTKQVLVFAGTKKGGLIFTSDQERKRWSCSDLLFKSWNVMDMVMDPRDQRLHAAAVHYAYGPSTHYSDDLGKTWTQASQVPSFPRPSRSGRPLGSPEEAAQAVEENADSAQIAPEKLIKIWKIQPGREQEPGALYAGGEPGALFKSTDRGETWEINEGLFDHPHRPRWFPGAGGLCLHTILLDASNPDRMFIAISTGGCYRTDDGGESWKPYNKNVRADFLPDHFPEYGHCVHKMAMHPDRPQVVYQQNHCGIYRSDNAAADWQDIGEGRLPSRFGFPIAVHPHDPQMIYVVLEESDEYRLSIDGKFAVWRSPDGGETWQRQTRGLPERAHLVVLREAMALDSMEDAGVYIGTSTGQIFYSRDAGDTWELLADYLPPVYSISTAAIE